MLNLVVVSLKITNLESTRDEEDLINLLRGGGISGKIKVHVPMKSPVCNKGYGFTQLSEEDAKYAMYLDGEMLAGVNVKVEIISDCNVKKWTVDEYEIQNIDSKKIDMKRLKSYRKEYRVYQYKYDMQFPRTDRWSKMSVLYSYQKSMYTYKNKKNWKQMDPIYLYEGAKKKIRFCVISDTHGYQERVNLDGIKADVLLHCGDFTDFSHWDDFSDVNVKRDDRVVPKAVMIFNNYLGSLKQFKHKIIVSGNHDTGFQDRAINSLPIRERKQLLSNGIFLNNSFVDIEGIRIYGSSYNASHEKTEKKDVLQRRWRSIPQDTNIIMSHFPPHLFEKDNSFFDALYDIPNLKLSCFGHYHYRNYAKSVGGVVHMAAPVFHTQSMTIEPVFVFDFFV